MSPRIEDSLLPSHLYHKLVEHYEHSGKLSEIFKKLLRIDWDNLTERDKSYIIPKTAILLRVAIDYKIQTKSRDSFRLMLITINLVLKIFKYLITSEGNSSEIVDCIGALSKNFALSSTKIVFEMDHISCLPFKGIKMIKAIKKLDEVSSGEDVIFTVIAGGGLVSGLYLFTIAQHYGIIGSNSIFYPIRFSRNKSQDSTPQIDVNDMDFLTSILEVEKKVIAYDDDISSGKTIFLYSRSLREAIERYVYLISGAPCLEESTPYGTLFLEKLVNTPVELPYEGWRYMMKDYRRPTEPKNNEL